ncbi:MAG: hypothetical protein IKL08_00550, partial [Clostridia bacterium]|nr:hypothetical protein [Clostridia bacterium]
GFNNVDLNEELTKKQEELEIVKEELVKKEEELNKSREDLAKKEEELVKVPLLGTISCGNPIEAIENPDEWFTLPASLIPTRETVFTLQASG